MKTTKGIDMATELGAYTSTFLAQARQCKSFEFAIGWYTMTDPGVSAAEAAEWANLGFTPNEARRHIIAGTTAAAMAATEAAEAAAAGGEEELLIHRLATLGEFFEIIE